MSVRLGWLEPAAWAALIRGIVKGNADGKYKLFAYDINVMLDQLPGNRTYAVRKLILSWFVLRTSYSLPSSPGTQRLSWRGWERSGKQSW